MRLVHKKELKVLSLCTFIYISIFLLLEKITFPNYIYTETIIDQYIPFIDIFVIPYVLWFLYIILGFIYFLYFDKKGFYRTCFYIFGGMYLCLIIYILFPNAQGLRVDLDLNNPLHKLLSFIYHNDTSTNVCPSIHVYNSIMMYISLMKNQLFKQHKFINISVCILTISICLSTIFTKQHAFIDGIYSIPICLLFYYLYQNIEYVKSKLKHVKETIKLKLSTN